MIQLLHRHRRNRKSQAIRDLIQETFLRPSDFIAPLFIMEGSNRKESIPSIQGNARYSIDTALKVVESYLKQGIRSILIFPVIPTEDKDAYGTIATEANNLGCRAIQTLKHHFPELCVMVDLALDPFTNHGHDGIIDEEGYVLNDVTLERLGQIALLQADAGADVIAPSDMMDGRILYLRQLLDQQDFSHVSLLSYAAKYASALYGPFRDALQSTPQFGDKKSYQMNPANAREAMLEVVADESEGADMLMIKPAVTYLDIISSARKVTHLPIAAYHVSGEYAMIMAAGEKGWIDPMAVLYETTLSIKRAGADMIVSYGISQLLEQIQFHNV